MKNELKTFELLNNRNSSVKITNFGAKVMSINVEDKNGNIDNVVIGYDTPEEYINGHPYYGAIIGRYGNRINQGKFILNGITYKLAINNGPNHLHGGENGFHNVVWDVVEGEKSANSIKFKYFSKDGEEAYPGNLTVYVNYVLTNENELMIEYSASCDKSTIINLTHHSYFNLKDAGKSDILDHKLKIYAGHYTPVNKKLIPTGEIASVKGTPLDFSEFTCIGKRINEDYAQLKYGEGYDHNWVIDKEPGQLGKAAELYESSTGRKMEVFTTEPGIQFYSGNFMDASIFDENNKIKNSRVALCLETQHFPDSPNHDNFPSTFLESGETYHQKTIYKFSTD